MGIDITIGNATVERLYDEYIPCVAKYKVSFEELPAELKECYQQLENPMDVCENHYGMRASGWCELFEELKMPYWLECIHHPKAYVCVLTQKHLDEIQQAKQTLLGSSTMDLGTKLLFLWLEYWCSRTWNFDNMPSIYFW